MKSAQILTRALQKHAARRDDDEDERPLGTEVVAPGAAGADRRTADERERERRRRS